MKQRRQRNEKENRISTAYGNRGRRSPDRMRGGTTETAPAETVETTEEASDEDAEASEETAEGEETTSEDEVDESALLDSEIPNDPEEVMTIVKSIKDYDIRYEYVMKANDMFFTNDDENCEKWSDLIYPYWENILEKTDIEE